MAEIYKRECLECGKAFETENKRKIFCSHNCRSNYNVKKCQAKKKKATFPKICLNCGKEFNASRSNVYCCSKECGYTQKIKHTKEKYAEKMKLLRENTIHICPSCNKEFRSDNNRQVYCSPQCRGKVIKRSDFFDFVFDEDTKRTSSNYEQINAVAKLSHEQHKTYGEMVKNEIIGTHNQTLNMAYEQFKLKQRLANV